MSDLTGKAWWEDAWAATVGAAQAVGDWAWENRRGIAHFAVGVVVGVVATALVAATCVGTAGIGCIALVGVATGLAFGVPGHLVVDVAVGHKTTKRDVANYAMRSTLSGVRAPLVRRTIDNNKQAVVRKVTQVWNNFSSRIRGGFVMK